ncbi:MAG: biotin/lipoyl-containing protein, partial [Pseudomonadota bacterium]|nr:biotin/lipoyl-containing protein [Pseudomonadota bacterium]
MDIKAPDLGVDSAEVSEIMVAVGDVIAKDDNIVLLESDKASVEVPSSAAGKVTKINVAIGDQVSEGMVLIEVESADASDDNDDTAEEVTDSEQADDNNEDAPVEDDADAEEATDDAGEGASTTHALPDIGVDEAQVAEIMVSVGDTVSADESILLIESDKASVEVPAPEAGVVEKILVNAGDTIANGQDFIVIKAAGTPKAKPKADTAKTEDKADKPAPKTESKSQPAPTGEPKQAPAPTSTAAPAGKKLSEAEVNEKLVDVYAGPAVRKLARQLGVDITQVKGS